MKLQLAANLHILACSGFGLFYGIGCIHRKQKPPLYFLFSLFSLLCAFLSRVFYAVSITVYGKVPDIFNIGFLGYAGMFLFFLFANLGQIDWIVDDRKNVKPVYRIIPAIIPVLELSAAILGLFFGTVNISVRISYFVISVIVGFAGYYNIKHAIIPDVEYGIARAIRGYNVTAFLIGILSLAEIGFSVFEINDIINYIQIVLGVLFAIIIPVLNREVKRWTQ